MRTPGPRTWSASTCAAAIAVMALATAAAGQGSPAPGSAVPSPAAPASPVPGGFRPACDLIDADAVSTIVGATVTVDDTDVAVECSFSKDGDPVATVDLLGAQTLPLFRLTLPAAQYATLGDQTALVSPGDASTPATTVVALDDGVLDVAVTPDATADPASASSAIAQAILAQGPVIAQPPSVPGLATLTYHGDQCDLVTAGDLKEVMGVRFRRGASGPGGCEYAGGTERSPMIAIVSLVKVPLAAMRTKHTTDVTVAGRPGILIPRHGALMVDIGGHRILQLGVSASRSSKGSAARKLARELEQLAERAIGRMTPVTSSSGPAAGPCDLLDLDGLRSTTGIDFSRADPVGETGCDYTSTDQRTAVLLSMRSADSLDAAWSDAKGSLPLPETPTSTTVGGLPAYDALIGTDAAVVAADLAGTPGGDGKVLGLVLVADPANPGDPLASALQLMGQALAARSGG